MEKCNCWGKSRRRVASADNNNKKQQRQQQATCKWQMCRCCRNEW